MTAADDFVIASGISDDEQTTEAIAEVIEALRDRLGEGAVDFVAIFATPHHRGSMDLIAERVQAELSPRIALGATAGGVLGSGFELESRPGLTMLAGRMPGAELRAFCHHDFDWPTVKDDPAALREALLGIEAPPSDADTQTRAVLMFADPFTTPMVKLMPALNAALPGIPIIGGMASAAVEPGDNRLIYNDNVFDQGAVGMAISGPVQVDCIVSQGCRPIGDPGLITKAHKNLIQEIGRKPALAAVEAVASEADESERELLQHGVFVGRVINEYKDHFGRGDFLIRNIIGADRNSGFIAISDFVRVGQTVQFHVRDTHTAEEDLRLLLQTQLLHDPAAGVLMCTCNGRGQNMFDKPNAESTIVREALGEVPIAGFFAAGEIGPIGTDNFVHGFTAALAIFRPAAQGGET